MESLIGARVAGAAAPAAPAAASADCARAWHVAALLSAVVAAWAVFSLALVAQHRAYHSNAFDLGFFDQIVWNTSQGRWFETSFVPYNFLGQHVEPVLLVYAAAYRVWPRVELLLLTQAALAAWAAVLLFIAARRVLASATAGLLVATAYLLSPHLHGAMLFDFHPEVMAAAGVFGAFALLVHGRPGWAAVSLSFVFLLKEDAALAGLGFALIVWLRGYRRWAVALAVASLVYLAVIVGLVMPAVRGGPSDLHERYGHLGDDPAGIVAGAARRPNVLIGNLVAPPQLGATAYLLATDAFLLLATPAALAALPLLAANLLSTHPPQHDLTLHYPILTVNLLFVGSVLGAAKLAHSPRWRGLGGIARPPSRRAAPVLAALLLGAQAIGWLAGSPLGPRRFEPERYSRAAHGAAVARVLARVPDGAPVSAQSGLVPHLSQRRDVWEFPRLVNAEYVVVDRGAWRSSQSTVAGYDATLRELPALGYCVMYEEDGVLLFGRGAACASPS